MKIRTVALSALFTISVFSGLCFASDDNEPIVIDSEYPAFGFKVHSWIDGSGVESIAHTQIISSPNGAILKQLDIRCNYEQ